MTIGSQEMFKLPPKTERKADGIYRYRRRVPVKAIKAFGKGFLYRNLGRTKDEVLSNWAAAREEVEALFEQVKSDTDKEATERVNNFETVAFGL
jgi:hypothetical protein